MTKFQVGWEREGRINVIATAYFVIALLLKPGITPKLRVIDIRHAA